MIQQPEQPASVRLEVAQAEHESLPFRKLGQACWQPVSAWYLGVFKQNGDDADIQGQRRLDLQPHDVTGIVEAPSIRRVSDREPPIANQNQDQVAGPDCGGDYLDQVFARPDGIDDVLDDPPFAQVVNKPVV